MIRIIYTKGVEFILTEKHRLKDYKKQEIRQRNKEHKGLLKLLKEWQEKYLFVPIDKACANIGIICKKLYCTLICQELGIDVNNIDGIVHGNET